MKVTRPKKAFGFTLVEIMIVVLIIGILLAIAIPNFVQARESSRAKACVANMKQLDSAVQQYMMDNKLSTFSGAAQSGTPPAWTTGASLGLIYNASTNPGGYIRQNPLCPSGGTYSTGDGQANRPSCTVSTNTSNPSDPHVLP